MGRPNLGDSTNVALYRLLKFSLRDAIEQECGTETTDKIMYEAGRIAGRAFYGKFLADAGSLGEFAKRLQDLCLQLRLGVVRFEKADPQSGYFMITVEEDLDCSGLPDTGKETCVYDEGFIASLLENFTRKKFQAREVDCWTTGGRTCRFEAKAVS